MKSLPSTTRAAFTLLESLIVISVIALLAALAIPVYQSINAAKNSVKCTRNLQTIYMAMLGFTEDYDGKLPPPLGPAIEIHPDFYFNAYWSSQSYLGNYAVVRSNPKRDSSGRLSQEESEVFNCPARLVEGPDAEWTSNPLKPAVSYLMPAPPTYLFRVMENKSARPFLFEGRHQTVWAGNCKSGTLGVKDTGKRLRRYHNGGMNILYYDGHVELFTGPDSAIASKL